MKKSAVGPGVLELLSYWIILSFMIFSVYAGQYIKIKNQRLQDSGHRFKIFPASTIQS